MGDAADDAYDRALFGKEDYLDFYDEEQKLSNTTRGFVKRLFKKEGTNKRGKWVADSFKLEDENGNEDPYFYQVGFREDADVAPAICGAEGKFIEVTYDDKDSSARTFISGRVLSDAPAKKSAPVVGSKAPSTGSTQQNIHYQNSRTAAIELVGILLANKALPHTATSSKAGQAKAYDEITAAVDTLTVKYFNDLESFRLFETVTDVGEVDTSPDGDLPEDDQVELDFSDEEEIL